MSTTITRREAVVFYWYVFNGDDPDQHPDTEAAAKAALDDAGISDPYESRPASCDYATWAESHRAEREAYLDACIQAEDALPVYAGTHGTDAVPTPFLCIPATNRDTPRGTVRAVPHLPPIPLTGRAVDPQWRATLDAFLAAQSITPPTGPNQPGWWSAAYEDRD